MYECNVLNLNWWTLTLTVYLLFGVMVCIMCIVCNATVCIAITLPRVLLLRVLSVLGV